MLVCCCFGVLRPLFSLFRGFQFLDDILPPTPLQSGPVIVKIEEFPPCLFCFFYGRSAQRWSALDTPFFLSPEALSWLLFFFFAQWIGWHLFFPFFFRSFLGRRKTSILQPYFLLSKVSARAHPQLVACTPLLIC